MKTIKTPVTEISGEYIYFLDGDKKQSLYYRPSLAGIKVGSMLEIVLDYDNPMWYLVSVKLMESN